MGSEVPEHWRLIVDTADGFQGDERDIILMSLPCGPDLPRGSLWFLRDAPDARNRFNVAVSRARVLLHVFADEDWCRSCKITHIEQLWNEYHDQQNTADKPFREDLVGPVWEPRLAERLQRESLDFKQQYPACGRHLDFAMLRDGRKLDVEVDGESTHRDSGGRRKIDDLERDLALIANGWTVLRFWVYELREDMDKCISEIKNAMNA